MSFFRGLLIAIPISFAFWIILAVAYCIGQNR
jgi:hypothetical protein